MTTFGYSLMCEEHHPNELVANAQRAEDAGFDFVTVSDHFHPWLHSHQHSPYAWSVLAATTQRLELISLVTCPFLRYHPAIVAQRAATVAAMSGGRFQLGLGAGENLNEHVVGRGWPPAHVRHEMLGAAARRLAHERWRFAAGGWKVQSELPNPVNFEAATANVREEDVAETVSCGPDPDVHAAAIERWVEAGFTHVAVVQIGPDQDAFLSMWERHLAPRLARA